MFKSAFENYKPKKKEQEEAFKKIQLHLNGLNSYNDNNNVNNEKHEKKKKGFMGIFN